MYRGEHGRPTAARAVHRFFTPRTPPGNGLGQQSAEAVGMEAAQRPETVRTGLLEIRPGECEALADGRRLRLTRRELKLLETLARHADRVVSRQELSVAAWERPLRPDDRSVDVYVSRVRAKLERAAPGWRFIHTHFGFGYRFCPEPLHPFHTRATRR
jgi:DNA-binding response OmpR family regulator